MQQEFLDLLSSVYDSLDLVDADKLKLYILWFLTLERCNEQAIQEHSDKIESALTSKGVLTFLISSHFIGYLNYELLKVFSQFAVNDMINDKIKLYEQHHDTFLSEITFSSFIEVFTQYPNLAPTSPTGLPTFKFHLGTQWEGRSIFEWKHFIQMKFSWPPYLVVKNVARNCIILLYAVLPFFVSSVMKDLSHDHELLKLENEGVTVEPSLELQTLGKEEVRKFIT